MFIKLWLSGALPGMKYHVYHNPHSQSPPVTSSVRVVVAELSRLLPHFPCFSESTTGKEESCLFLDTHRFCLGQRGVRVSRFVVQSLSLVQRFATPWTVAYQTSLSFTISWSLLRFMSTELVIPCNHLIPIIRFSSCLQSFPASGSFLISQLFTSCGQSIGTSASASVLPMNIQDWFPLRWTGWISLQSKGLSRVFSNTTVHKHQFFGT